MAVDYFRMSQPLYELRSGIYSTTDEEVDFIVSLVHYIGELQGEIIEKDDSLNFFHEMDRGGFVDWESWSWYGDKGDNDD